MLRALSVPILVISLAASLTTAAVFGQTTPAGVNAQDGEIVKTTSKGTLAFGLETEWGEGGQASFQVRFLNPDTNSLHEHQDYDFRILRDGQQVFSAASSTRVPFLHNVEGALTIPYTFQESGNYAIQVYLAGTGLPAIPTDEEVTFPITVVLESDAGVVASNATNATAGIIMPNDTTIKTIIANHTTQPIDPEMHNLLEIADDCHNRLIYRNETIAHLQCISAFNQASEKYCGIAAYDSDTCRTITVLGSAYQFMYDITEGDSRPLAGNNPLNPSLPPLNPQVPSVPPFQPPTTSEGGAGTGPTLTILNGSAVQGNPDFSPDELTVAAGSYVTVNNQDTVPHTVTSGTGAQDANSAQLFDTSIINGEESVTLSLAQVAAGQYDYYCMIHPYMTGKLVVQ
jgi:plastocyanin